MMRKPLVWLLAGLLLSVALIVYGQWRSSPAAVESSAAPTELPVVTQSAPAPSLSPAESPKVVIAPAPPESITIPELGFTLEVRAETTYEMATAYRRSHPAEKATRMLYASGFYTASWPSDWRGAPGTDSEETVYLACHSSAKQLGLPCNTLAKQGVVQAGHHLVVATANGEVRYVLDQPELADKQALTDDPRVQDNRPGRVLLMVCMLSDDGRRTEKTWLFSGQLVD